MEKLNRSYNPNNATYVPYPKRPYNGRTGKPNYRKELNKMLDIDFVAVSFTFTFNKKLSPAAAERISDGFFKYLNRRIYGRPNTSRPNQKKLTYYTVLENGEDKHGNQDWQKLPHLHGVIGEPANCSNLASFCKKVRHLWENYNDHCGSAKVAIMWDRGKWNQYIVKQIETVSGSGWLLNSSQRSEAV